MCPLKFGKQSVKLLEEHFDSHLEFICPICSVAYQRNKKEAFEEHVEEHFREEERQTNDPSGPWGRSADARMRFPEID